MADDMPYKVEKRVAEIAELPDDEQIAEMVRMFAALTPDQRATVRALRLESDGKAARSELTKRCTRSRRRAHS